MKQSSPECNISILSSYTCRIEP